MTVSVCLSVYLCPCLSICVPVCLSVSLSVYLCPCLSICVPVCLSVCLSVLSTSAIGQGCVCTFSHSLSLASAFIRQLDRLLSSFLHLCFHFLTMSDISWGCSRTFSRSEPSVYLHPAVGSSSIIIPLSLLPSLISFDICYQLGLCTHLFLLSELSGRLHPAVGLSFVIVPSSLLPFLSSFDICYQSGLCTHLFPLSEPNSIRLCPPSGSSSVIFSSINSASVSV